MRSRRSFVLMLLSCLVVAATAGAESASPKVSAPVPLDSWVYPALEQLVGQGVLPPTLQGVRPYTRLEVARQLATLPAEAAATLPPVTTAQVQRLRAEFADESRWLVPLRAVTLDYLLQTGQPSRDSGTPAQQWALNYNNDGRDYRDRHNLQLTAAGEARGWEVVLLHLRPQLLAGEGEGLDLTLLTGGAAVALGVVELSVGRQALWWGPGRHGSLLLSNNAPPLDMVRLTNPAPVTLPWLLRYLGPFRFDLFVSRLEEERVVPHPYFGGFRLDIQPAAWLELGAARTVIFGGEGRPAVDAGDFLAIVGGHNLSGDDDTSNQLAALDFSLRLAPLGGAQLYGELGGEDEAGACFSKTAWLTGLYLPRLDAAGRLSLRAEYANLAFRNNGNVWYRHGIYRSGYTYEEHFLGHHVGGDGRDAFGELRLLLPEYAATVIGSLDGEWRGISGAVVERHLQPSLRIEASAAGFDWRLGYAIDVIANVDYVAGQDATSQLFTAGFSRRW